MQCTCIALYNYAVHCTIRTRSQSARRQHRKRTSVKVKWWLVDWFDCYLHRKCEKAKKIISGFFWYLEYPNPTKFDQVIRYFALFKTMLIWMIMHEIFAHHRITIWALRSAQIKKLKKTDPNFFSKKMGVCFLQLFHQSTPKASNCDPTTCKFFTRYIFMILSP